MRYKIGEFSIISRISIKTLRYYHEYGLLEPAYIDDESGYRYYDQSSLERIKIINTLKELDFPLKEIKEILEQCNDDSEMIQYATKKSQEIQEKITQYQQMQLKLEAFISQSARATEDETLLSQEITIKHIPDILIASIRFKGKYQDVTEAFGNIFKHLGRNCNGAPFSLYYDFGYKEEDADIEACVPVKKPISELDNIKCRKLTGGKAVTIVHKGPYETVGRSYQLIFDYINENNRQIKLPNREIYLKGPGIILPRNPKKFVTEIQIMLEG